MCVSTESVWMSVRGSYSSCKLFLLLVHVLEPVLPPSDNNMTLSQTDASSRVQGSAFSQSRLFSFFLFWHSHQTMSLNSVPTPGSVKKTHSGYSRTHSCLLICLFVFHSMPKAVSSAFTHFPADSLPQNHTFISSPLWACYSPPSHLFSLAHVRMKLCCHLLVKNGNCTSKSAVISIGA